MKPIALIYATQYGQTQKIADFISARLAKAGYAVRAINVSAATHGGADVLAGCGAAIIGGPIYVGKFPKPLIEWSKQHSELLDSLPIGIFSVSLNAADTRPEARHEDDRLIGEFLWETGLDPLVTACLIGAVHYRKYGWFKRMVLRRICRRANGPTDTSRDHELTNWTAVEKLVDRFVTELLFREPQAAVAASAL